MYYAVLVLPLCSEELSEIVTSLLAISALSVKVRAASFQGNNTFLLLLIPHSFAEPLQLQQEFGFCPSPHISSRAVPSLSDVLYSAVMSKLFKLLF